jgi:hypothetical protein
MPQEFLRWLGESDSENDEVISVASRMMKNGERPISSNEIESILLAYLPDSGGRQAWFIRQSRKVESRANGINTAIWRFLRIPWPPWKQKARLVLEQTIPEKSELERTNWRVLVKGSRREKASDGAMVVANVGLPGIRCYAESSTGRSGTTLGAVDDYFKCSAFRFPLALGAYSSICSGLQITRLRRRGISSILIGFETSGTQTSADG